MITAALICDCSRYLIPLPQTQTLLGDVEFVRHDLAFFERTEVFVETPAPYQSRLGVTQVKDVLWGLRIPGMFRDYHVVRADLCEY